MNLFCLEFPCVEAVKEEDVTAESTESKDEAETTTAAAAAAASTDTPSTPAAHDSSTEMVTSTPKRELPASDAAPSPKVVSLTKKNLEKLDPASADRKTDDDLSLIVHVDESQNDLDNDILDKSRESSLAAGAPSADRSSTGKSKTEGSVSGDEKRSSAADGKEVSSSDQKSQDLKKDSDQSKTSAVRLVCMGQSSHSFRVLTVFIHFLGDFFSLFFFCSSGACSINSFPSPDGHIYLKSCSKMELVMPLVNYFFTLTLPLLGQPSISCSAEFPVSVPVLDSKPIPK